MKMKKPTVKIEKFENFDVITASEPPKEEENIIETEKIYIPIK